MGYNTPTSLSCSGIALCELYTREREVHLEEGIIGVGEKVERGRTVATNKVAWLVSNLHVRV